MYDVVTGNKIDQTFKDSEMLNLADLVRRPSNFSYTDGDEYVFMDSEDYTSYAFNQEQIKDELKFINEDTQGLVVLIVNDSPVALELPSNVDLDIVETDPALKGGSATARTKPAILTTGLTVQVPEHIATGERITVSVEESKFVRRADAK
jgi:elongation factor P